MLDSARLSAMRQRLMTPRKILCTGNPDRSNTIAQAVKKIWPDASFVSLSQGYDFTSDNLDNLKDQLQLHNTFINSSYVAPGVQLRLLNLTRDVWKHGHVINIGSTHEFDQDSIYSQSKRDLRDRGLALHDYRFRTTHMVLGGLRDHDPDHSNWLDLDHVARTLKWIIEQPFDTPLICIQAEKQPW